MLPITRQLLREQLMAAILQNPEHASVKQADKEFIVDSLANFNEQAINKFIKGQAEHGGHITDRDLQREMNLEIIDMFFYNTYSRIKKG